MKLSSEKASGQALFALFLLIFLLVPVSRARAEEVALNAQIGGDLNNTRYVAFLSKKVDYRIFYMADPYRIVIDLPEVEIQVPAGKGRGLVLASRSGLFAPGKSRIVIDLVEPARVEKSELQPPRNDVPARLVLDLARSTHKTFLAAAKTLPPPREAARSPADGKGSSDKRPLIVVDPGHGGPDAGALGRLTGTPEKEVTLDFCKTLYEKLEATGRYRVVMTRSVDIFVPLDERAEMAAGPKAALLISIHADALDPKRWGIKGLQEVRGGTVYTLSEEASDEQANVVAQNENKADLQAGLTSEQSPLTVSAEITTIINDLENRIKKNRSSALANFLTEKLKEKMKLNIRPHRSANLRVLKGVGVPSVLIELGYLSNDEDEKLLTSKEWRASTATYLAEAVNAFMMAHQDHIPL